MPWRPPKTIKVRPAPCHKPARIKVINTAKCVEYLPKLRQPIAIGLYKYSFSQLDNEICHFLQNSVTEVEKNGSLKFCNISNPNNLAVPIAISEYPEKS